MLKNAVVYVSHFSTFDVEGYCELEIEGKCPSWSLQMGPFSRLLMSSY